MKSIRAAWLLAGLCLLAQPVARAQGSDPPAQPAPPASVAEPYNGIGGLVVTTTPVMRKRGVMLGARAGWLLYQHVVVGAGVEALANNANQGSGLLLGDGSRVSLGIGGLWIEYVVAPRQPLHATIGGLLGAGITGYHSAQPAGFTTSTILVASPEVALEATLASFLRVSAGIGYRAVRGVKGGLDDGDFEGVTASLRFEVGHF